VQCSKRLGSSRVYIQHDLVASDPPQGATSKGHERLWGNREDLPGPWRAEDLSGEHKQCTTTARMRRGRNGDRIAEIARPVRIGLIGRFLRTCEHNRLFRGVQKIQ